MNDFTKEELKRLLLRSFSWVAYPENQNKEELELIKKIEYMIENYCDHEQANSKRLDWLYYCVKCRKERCKRCAMELTKCHKFIKRGKNDLDQRKRTITSTST